MNKLYLVSNLTAFQVSVDHLVIPALGNKTFSVITKKLKDLEELNMVSITKLSRDNLDDETTTN